MYKRLLFFIALSLFGAQKYELSVCAIFKNEAPYLKEWIEYHKLIGVDHFYLYNLGSVDGYRKVLSPYIRAKQVTLIQWNDLMRPSLFNELLWVLSTQIPAYENAVKWKAVHETEWLVFLDVDEFLVPVGAEKMTDILKKYQDSPGIVMSVEHYDASAKGTLPPRKWVIEATEMTAEPPIPLRKAVEKSIFRPKLCKAITWPPYHYEYEEGKKGIKVGKEVVQINRYENRMQFQKVDQVKRKVGFEAMTEKEKEDLLKAGFEVEDSDKKIFKYLKELYKKMELANS
jgi:hypothetical protein